MIDLVQAIADCRRWENSIPHMYLDTHKPPLVTVGIGNLLKTVDDAIILPFQVANANRAPATTTQIRQAYAAVKAMPGGLKASAYRAAQPALFLSMFDINDLLQRRLTREFIPALERGFAGYWDGFPQPAQRALLDLIFTLGSAGLFGAKAMPPRAAIYGYPNLVHACKSHAWRIAADESGRKGAQEARNEWTRQMFLAAAPAPLVA